MGIKYPICGKKLNQKVVSTSIFLKLSFHEIIPYFRIIQRNLMLL